MKDKEPIIEPDVTCTDKGYWEQVLASHGLSMTRGKHLASDTRHGMNVQLVDDIEAVGDQKYLDEATGGRKVEPPGHGPDKDN